VQLGMVVFVGRSIGIVLRNLNFCNSFLGFYQKCPGPETYLQKCPHFLNILASTACWAPGLLSYSLNFMIWTFQYPCRLLVTTLNLREMSESNLPVQVQVQDGQQFDSLATFKLDMIHCSVNSGEVIKISKIDKKRTVYVRKHTKRSLHASA
jgi:hypothetical protein